jgi:predicted transcriptional regulator
MSGLVKTTIRVKEDVFLKLRVLASLRSKTFTTVLNEALEEYVRNHDGEIRKRVTEVVGTPSS